MNIIFIILLVSVQFVPSFQAVDKQAPQFFYLSIITFCSTFFIFFRSIKEKQKKIKADRLLIVFGSLATLSLLSILWAFNKVEATISFFNFFISVLLLYNLIYHFKQTNFNYRQLATIFCCLLASDIVLIFANFLYVYDFNAPPGRLNYFLGFTANHNVIGFSILFRLPFLIYLFLVCKKPPIKVLLLIFYSISVFCLVLSGSRGALLTLIMVLSSLFVYAAIFYRKQFKTLLIVIFATIFTGLSHTILYQNGTNVFNRIETLSPNKITNDSSSNERLIWYNGALEGISESPILGCGIGNWKIVGNKYVYNKIQQYIVPKHVHNDFLQFFTELGLVGFLLFIGLFLVAIQLLVIYKDRYNNWKIVSPLIIVSITAYIADSSLNFPFQRPVAISNLIMLLAFISSKSDFKNFKLSHNKLLKLFLITVAAMSVVSSYFVYKGFKEEIEFVNKITGRDPFTTPLKTIEKLNSTYPSINYTTIPLVTLKALYYRHYGFIEKAKKLLHEGNKINPYLSISEAKLAEIFLTEGKHDSAYFYAKKAYYGLPNNERHTNIYQLSLASRKDLNELNRIFDQQRDKKNIITYSNHLEIISNLKPFNSFDDRDRDIASEALKLFPENEEIKRFHMVIHKGAELIKKANIEDQVAQQLYEEKNYEKAIEKWQKAKSILPSESSYYLNIAQSLSVLEKAELSNMQLDSLEKLKLSVEGGKLEFLRALNMIQLDRKSEACRNLIISYKKEKTEQKKLIIKKLKCKVN
ncbi:MAG: O-antigen ligase family protein [Flavobacteriaceae bacterium]